MPPGGITKNFYGMNDITQEFHKLLDLVKDKLIFIL